MGVQLLTNLLQSRANKNMPDFQFEQDFHHRERTPLSTRPRKEFSILYDARETALRQYSHNALSNMERLAVRTL
jgi:hypothetical protein